MSKDIYRAGFVCLALLLPALHGGCFSVEVPTALQTTSQDFQIAGGKIQITVTFNEDADLDPLSMSNDNIILEVFDAASEPGTWIVVAAYKIAPKNQLVIESKDDATDLLGPLAAPGGIFRLTLRGSGPSPLKSTVGDILDGDGDGAEGGDFTTTFRLVG